MHSCQEGQEPFGNGGAADAECDACRRNAQEDEIPDEELIDTLIAISVVAKRLAMKLRKIKDEGDKQNEPHE